MNAVIIILLVCLIGWAIYRIIRKSQNGGGCCGEHEASVKRAPVKDRNRSHYPYKCSLVIGGMTCDNCAARVENALNDLPGTWAKVDISGNRAAVLSKSEPDEQALRCAVTGAGYTVMKIEK